MDNVVSQPRVSATGDSFPGWKVRTRRGKQDSPNRNSVNHRRRRKRSRRGLGTNGSRVTSSETTVGVRGALSLNSLTLTLSLHSRLELPPGTRGGEEWKLRSSPTKVPRHPFDETSYHLNPVPRSKTKSTPPGTTQGFSYATPIVFSSQIVTPWVTRYRTKELTIT